MESDPNPQAVPLKFKQKNCPIWYYETHGRC